MFHSFQNQVLTEKFPFDVQVYSINDAIKEWKEKHDTEVHGFKTLEDRLHAGGLIGGRYTYHFVPTSIGVSGTIQCSCGEEFEFCKL